MGFKCDFNHCTILIYNGHSKNVNNKLSYHCDITYDHNGKFVCNKNSQGQDTPALVYSLGDSRVLHFIKRCVVNEKGLNKRWKRDKYPLAHFNLDDNSLFVLHPFDENPRKKDKYEHISQLQHGKVVLKHGNLSIA